MTWKSEKNTLVCAFRRLYERKAGHKNIGENEVFFDTRDFPTLTRIEEGPIEDKNDEDFDPNMEVDNDDAEHNQTAQELTEFCFHWSIEKSSRIDRKMFQFNHNTPKNIKKWKNDKERKKNSVKSQWEVIKELTL